MHNDKVIKKVADALASGSKIHLAQSKMLRKILGSPVPRGKKNGSKKKKPKINISELLRKHRAGKSIGSTNRARLVARGLIPRKSGAHKGKKIDLGRRGKS